MTCGFIEPCLPTLAYAVPTGANGSKRRDRSYRSGRSPSGGWVYLLRFRAKSCARARIAGKIFLIALRRGIPRKKIVFARVRMSQNRTKFAACFGTGKNENRLVPGHTCPWADGVEGKNSCQTAHPRLIPRASTGPAMPWKLILAAPKNTLSLMYKRLG